VSLIKSLPRIAANMLHRVQPLGEQHHDTSSLASCAFGDDVVEMDLFLWCHTPEAKASEWPVTAYLRIINQRLAPKIELPSTPIRDNRRPAGVATDKQAQAMSWLKDFLQSDPKHAPEILRAGEVAGHSEKMLFVVFDRMGGKKFREMGKVYWELSPMNEPGEREKD
jgi:hypothetical protein